MVPIFFHTPRRLELEAQSQRSEISRAERKYWLGTPPLSWDIYTNQISAFFSLFASQKPFEKKAIKVTESFFLPTMKDFLAAGFRITWVINYANFYQRQEKWHTLHTSLNLFVQGCHIFFSLSTQCFLCLSAVVPEFFDSKIFGRIFPPIMFSLRVKDWWCNIAKVGQSFSRIICKKQKALTNDAKTTFWIIHFPVHFLTPSHYLFDRI